LSSIRENIDYKKCFNEYLQNGIVTINNIFHDDVVKLFTPKLNTLTIMNVGDKNTYHFVSEIENGLDKNRYAISYWM